jgi:hypothetical protein
MINGHPREKEIQEYVLDRSVCSKDLIEHIESCQTCREEINVYQLLFTELKKEPKADFDFDVSELVMPLLPSREPLISADRFISGFLVIFISCCIGIPVILFNRNIIHLFSGISPVFVYAIIASAVLIISLNTLEMYKNYREQMRRLNIQ